MAQEEKITGTRAVWKAVGDEGEERTFVEQFAQTERMTDKDVIGQARRSAGEWRRAPNGDAYRLTELVSVQRFSKGLFGVETDVRIIFEKGEA